MLSSVLENYYVCWMLSSVIWLYIYIVWCAIMHVLIVRKVNRFEILLHRMLIANNNSSQELAPTEND